MNGLLERALGDDWQHLHPRLRDRYGLVASDGRQAIGRGRMDRIDCNTLVAPIFRLFVDTLGFNPARDCLTDILGRRGRLAVDTSLSERDGALELTLGAQWLRVGGGYRRLPDLCGVDGSLVDWYDDDRAAFVVAASVSHPLVGAVVWLALGGLWAVGPLSLSVVELYISFAMLILVPLGLGLAATAVFVLGGARRHRDAGTRPDAPAGTAAVAGARVGVDPRHDGACGRLRGDGVSGDGTLLTITEMIHWHGTVNVFGFSLPALGAFRLLSAE